MPLPALPALAHWAIVNQLLHTQTDIKTPGTWWPAGPPFLWIQGRTDNKESPCGG